VENHGVEKIVTLRSGEKLIHATVPARVELKLDEQVRFGWNSDKVVLFDGGSGVSLRHAG
jgi:multiple sugar transport system ATP-binding protein